MHKKKGQAAMEFLMTYGWAILVVLVAIGALAYFGVLSPEKLLPEKCVISSGSGLYCDDFAATTNTVTLQVKNLLADTVTISSINIVSLPDGTLDSGNDCTATTLVSNATITINSDQELTIPITCTGLAIAEKVKGDVSITFSKAGGLNKTTSGSLVTTAG